MFSNNTFQLAQEIGYSVETNVHMCMCYRCALTVALQTETVINHALRTDFAQEKLY